VANLLQSPRPGMNLTVKAASKIYYRLFDREQVKLLVMDPIRLPPMAYLMEPPVGYSMSQTLSGCVALTLYPEIPLAKAPTEVNWEGFLN